MDNPFVALFAILSGYRRQAGIGKLNCGNPSRTPMPFICRWAKQVSVRNWCRRMLLERQAVPAIYLFAVSSEKVWCRSLGLVEGDMHGARRMMLFLVFAMGTCTRRIQ